MKIYQQILTLLFFSIINSQMLLGTHIIGGEVSHEYIGNHNYIVELKVYRDCSGIVMTSPYSEIDIRRIDYYGDNMTIIPDLISVADVTGVCSVEPTICAGVSNATYGIEEYLYRDTINVPFDISSGGVLFEWSICCYPNTLTTLPSSNTNSLYAYSIAYYHPNIYNKTPNFKNEVINYTCLGNIINYGNGTNDIENDSLIFSLVDCPYSYNYTSNPGFLSFYTFTYNTGYSGTQPFTSQNPITIDTNTGMISFTPTIAEIGPLCVMVEEYRNGIKISEKVRSVLLNVQNCNNANPSISGFNGIASVSGTTGTTTMMNLNIGQQICFDIQAYDDMGQNVTLSHSDNLTNATYTVSNIGNNPTLTVCWTPTIEDVGISIFSVTAEDDNCPTLGKSIQTYKLSVNAPFSIQGRVFQPDGSLLPDAEIQLYDSTGTLISLENTVNGFYRFVMSINNAPNQSYYVAATPDGQFSTLGKTYFGDVPVPQYSTAIPLYTTRTNIANINALEQNSTMGNGQISGVVKSATTGNIIPDTRIVVVDNNGDYIKEAIADESGMLQINDLPTATYPIWVDDFNINNDIAPPVDIALTPIHNNIEFLLHDTYLELAYPTNTASQTLIDQVQIMPNPTSGILNLTFPITTTEVQVLDMNGRIVLQRKVENQLLTRLDLSELAEQVYLIRVVSDEGVVTKKVVKR